MLCHWEQLHRCMKAYIVCSCKMMMVVMMMMMMTVPCVQETNNNAAIQGVF